MFLPCKAFLALALLAVPAACVFALPGAAAPQDQPAAPRALTIADVTRMVKAGLSEDLVIAQIRKNGKAFDLTTDDLLKLKESGVSDNILKAMVDPGGPAQAPDPAPGSVPEEVGVYWAEGGKEMRRIEGLAVSNLRSGSRLASSLTLGIKRQRVNAQLKGARAQTRVNERRPQFYFYLPEDASIGDYLLLRLAQRLDVRQLEVGERTMWKDQAGVDHAVQVDFSYKRLKNRVYVVTPNNDMTTGEYGFYIAAGVETKKAVGRVYDFGID